MDHDPIDLLSDVLRQTEAAIAAVDPAQHDAPTPSEGVDVGRLVDHLVGWARSFAARLCGREAEGDPNDYRAGDAPAAEFHAAAQDIVTAYRAGGDAAQQLPLGIVLPEFLVHGWELSRAIGHDMRVEPAAAELGLGTLQQMLKPEYRGPGKAFGPQVQVGTDAPVLDRLVGFSGRDPRWTPSAASG